jgi:hypothetical protein
MRAERKRNGQRLRILDLTIAGALLKPGSTPGLGSRVNQDPDSSSYSWSWFEGSGGLVITCGGRKV